MEHHNFPSPTSVALVSMFFLLMLGKLVTMYYVEMLGRDVLKSKEILIRSSIDLESLKGKVDAIEKYLEEKRSNNNGGEYVSN